jgi:phosphate transport system permease protein
MTLTTPDQLPAGPSLVVEAEGGPLNHLRRWVTQDTAALKALTLGAALLPLIALVAILAVLAWKAVPALRYNGFGFLTRSTWRPGNTYGSSVKTDGVLHPVGASYGAWPLIVGTVASSAIAVLFAVPVSVGASLAIVEKLPARVSNAIGIFMEVLAGIPSVVFGLWGTLTFGPFLARDIDPAISNVDKLLPNVAIINFFRGDAGFGEGLLSAGLVLGVMIIPIVAATTRDLLRSVPRLPKEGALALGMNDFEMARKVSLPWIRAGIIGASVLGLARALGETIAVAMVSGSALATLPTNIFGVFGTIASTIVQQLDGSLNDGTGFELRTLAEFALVLAVITLVTNVGARLLVRRVSGTALPVGRGV